MSETSTQFQLAVARLREGETGARDELIRVMYGRLQSMASRMLDDYQRVRAKGVETGDVLHAAVIRFLRALDEVRPESTRELLGLAAAQIRRELIDLARRHFGRRGHRARPTYAAGDSVLQELAETNRTSGPEQGLVLAELHQVVEQLPPKEREVVDLLWYLDLTQEEAAAVLEVDKSTVKRRWRDARLNLERHARDWRPD